MKIKNMVLFDSNFIESLMKFTEMQLPIKISYSLKKCLNIFKTEENELKLHRDDLIKKYGTCITNDAGELIYDLNKSDKKSQESFFQEYNELMDLEVELPIEDKLSISLKDIENKFISAKHIVAIEPLIKIEE